VLGHVGQFGFGAPNDIGGLGVLLFFVLSGFLITGLLDREISTTGGICLTTFYARRALRLFPAFFCFITTVSLLIMVGVVRDTPWYTVIACIVYVRNILGRGSSTGHIWSLSIEEQFYIIWPFLLRAVGRIAALRIAVGGIVAITGFRMIAIYFNWYDYTSGVFYLRSWFRFDSILLGCAVALLLVRPSVLAEAKRYVSGTHIAIALWCGILGWTICGETFTHVWYLTVQMVFGVFIVLNLIVGRTSSYLSALSHPALTWFGRISYSWYLWQQLFTVFTGPPTYVRTFPLNVIVSLLAAAASQRFIERPFLELKKRFCGHANESKDTAVPVSTTLLCEMTTE